MNINRIITWGTFIVIVGLIVWGMVAASQKASRENSSFVLASEISEADWVTGSTTSSVVLVEYSDFQCPACASYFPLIDKVIELNKDRIRFVYRHFPLTQHANALPASKSAEAAGMQGKFWEMYKMIFINHDKWENSTNVETIFEGYARELGLDIDKYLLDINSEIVKNKIDSDLKGGIRSGVNATPTFYLNGKKIQNPQSIDGFNKLIDEKISTTTQY